MAYKAGYSAIVCVLVIVFFLTFALTGFSETFALGGGGYNPTFSHYIDPDQYAYLGDAILNGHTWLDLPVPEEMLQLADPYDYEARVAIAEDGLNPIYWDYAYFDGKYYCYFGVVPALLLYVPFELITGQMLNTSIAVCVLGVLFVLSGCLLIYRLARVFFQEKCPFLVVALASCMFVGGSNVVYLGFVSRFYSVPILASMLFTCLGLWFWIGAKYPEVCAFGKGDRHSISAWRLFFGSLCMALNIGCRPQFILASLIAFPLFGKEIFRDRTLFSRSSVKQTVLAIAPFVVVFACQGIYNYLRFGSLFDFGSAYNLNSFEMGSYEQRPITTLVVLFWFLFQPFHIEAFFPFVHRTSYMWPVESLSMSPLAFLVYVIPLIILLGYVAWMWIRALKDERRKPFFKRPATIIGILVLLAIVLVVVSYATDVIALGGGKRALIEAIGTATVEPMFGGYFWLCPMALLIFTLPWVKRSLVERGWYAVCVTMVAIALLTLVFDARTVGANQRYFSDFACYLMLVAVLCLFAWSRNRRAYKPVLILTALSVLLSAIVGGFSLFSNERYDTVADLNPPLYEEVANLFPDAPEDQAVDSGNALIDSILKPK